MKNSNFKTLVLASVVFAFGLGANAQSSTQVSRPDDQNMDANRGTVPTEVTTENGDITINNQEATPPAAAASTSTAKAPKPKPAWVLLNPVAGAASYTTQNKVDLDHFGDGFNFGMYVDILPGHWQIETGVLALNADAQTTDSGSSTVSVDSWGVPILAKYNFNRPRAGIFLKAGLMPFQPSGPSDNFDLMGMGGVGAAIPLFQNTALTLEATYNRLLNDDDNLGDYQGVALLGGLQFGL